MELQQIKKHNAEVEGIWHKKKILIAAGMTGLLLLTGCQSKSDTAETEALEARINQLEQQIAELQQQKATETQNELPSQKPSAEGNNVQEQAPVADKGVQGISDPVTTYTMEELDSMVDAYVEKANAAVPSNTSDDLDTFFALKQEGKRIDDLLDIHEDELESLYSQKALTREEYKSRERELEKLEDRLDDAEDRLEYVFGIDD